MGSGERRASGTEPRGERGSKVEPGGSPPRDPVRTDLERLVNACAGCAVISVGADGRIGVWNEGARRAFGWTPDQVAGTPITGLSFRPDGGSNRGAALGVALEKSRLHGSWEGVVSLKTAEGREVSSRVEVTALRSTLRSSVGTS